MAYEFQGRSIHKIGVIGSGQIGPDIALYFSKVLCRAGVEIVVVDIAEDALVAGRKKLDKKVDRGEQSGAFTPDWAAAMKEAVTWTTDYGAFGDAELIVEAATESEGLKQKIFADLESRCGPDTILASNSSHLEPERIFANVASADRTLVIHYFYPAERNPMVEIVPSDATKPELVRWLLDFYECIGKTPIQVRSRYGYALDPVFEGVFLAAALIVENGIATTKQVDTVAQKALGLTVGPFTAMNLTGGNPITNVGLDNYTSLIHEWFRSPESLKQKVEAGEPWDTPARGEQVEVPGDVFDKVQDLLRGAFFGLTTEIVDSGIASIEDMDMAVELALDMKGPFRLANQLGTDEALRLVTEYAEHNPGFPIPELLSAHGATGKPFDIPFIQRRDEDGVALLTIRRPRVLNALNQAVFDELRAKFEAIASDDSIEAVVLSGFGVKAFVSGADVNFLAKISSREQGAATSRDSQDALNRIEDLGKPVVCAYNGLAFGGGNELAMACHARVALSDLKVLAAQPEVNLGIIPGAGGTQRLPRLIGFEQASALLRTGRPVSAKQAHELGLVHELVDGTVVDLRDRAKQLAKDLAAGKAKIAAIAREPLSDVPAKLPDIELGHLSTAVDRLLVEAILQGARLSLREGIDLEAEKFGEVCTLQDMKIGVQNFLTNGPRSKAEFVHA